MEEKKTVEGKRGREGERTSRWGRGAGKYNSVGGTRRIRVRDRLKRVRNLKVRCDVN